MNPIKHPWTNQELGKPANWDEKRFGACQSLPVVRGDGVFYSYWKASFKERIAILFGGTIRLCLTSNTHPPVMLDTEKN